MAILMDTKKYLEKGAWPWVFCCNFLINSELLPGAYLPVSNVSTGFQVPY